MWGDDANTSVKGGMGGFNASYSQNDGNTTTASAKRAQNILPVMIKHLTKTGKELNAWGQPVYIVTFVGILRQIEEATTKISYVIEDDTDTITAVRWLEADKDDVEPPIELNTYVRVHGYSRVQNEMRNVLVLRIWPVTDLNELTNHLLEVTYVMLNLEKQSSSNNESINETGTSSINAYSESVSGLTKEQDIVFKLIQKKNETENGIEREQLKASIPKNILSQLDNIIDFLTSEGHIYTTLTDDHFKTT